MLIAWIICMVSGAAAVGMQKPILAVVAFGWATLIGIYMSKSE